MSELHGIPRQYGIIVIIFGMIFFFPLLGFTVELIRDLYSQTGWGILMFGLTMIAMTASILMIGFGTNMVWYHDKKIDDTTVDDTTIDERTNKSKFKPIEEFEEK